MAENIYPYKTKKGIRYKTPYTDDNGKTRWKGGFKRVQDAKDWRAQTITSVTDGSFTDPQLGKRRVGDLANVWLEGKRGVLKPKTYATYESSWRTHCAPKWAHRQIGTLRTSEIQAWVSGIVAAGSSGKTANKALAALNGVCELAVLDKIIAVNPCKGVRRVRESAKERAYLTVEQLTALAEASGDNKALVLVAGWCGLRFGELRALRVRDVDVAASKIHVARSAERVSGRIVVDAPKSKAGVRDVPVPSFVMCELMGHLVGKMPDDLVFTGNSRGGMIGEPHRSTENWTARNWFARAIQEACVPSITFHDLRHTAASLAVKSGANIKALQAYLGHEKASMTLDTYADLYPEDLERITAGQERLYKAAN